MYTPIIVFEVTEKIHYFLLVLLTKKKVPNILPTCCFAA